MRRKVSKKRPVIGWREWVSFPEWGIDRIQAKIDTGARSSCLHASHVHVEDRDGVPTAVFDVLLPHDDDFLPLTVETEILEFREVRSSNGQVTRRPVIVTDIELLGQRWPMYMTLANREKMAFPMLLGRRCLRQRFLVDVAKSYRGERWKQRQREHGSE